MFGLFFNKNILKEGVNKLITLLLIMKSVYYVRVHEGGSFEIFYF